MRKARTCKVCGVPLTAKLVRLRIRACDKCVCDAMSDILLAHEMQRTMEEALRRSVKGKQE